MVGFPDHFSALAARYAAYRPHYPPELVTALADLSLGGGPPPRRQSRRGPQPSRSRAADRSERHGVAWDIGCGSGQLSVALATRFARVIATDPAQAQLDHAERDPRVEYQRTRAEDSRLPDASVDLAVAAQAAHWFDWPRFVAEVGRVVRPGGLVALVTYRNAELPGDAGAELAGFYRQVEPYWPDGRVHVNNAYRDLALPWPAVAAPPIDERGESRGRGPAGSAGGEGAGPLPIEMTARWTRDELVGYISTWSATARLVAAAGEGPLDELRRRLAAVWPDGEARDVRWPLTIKLARR